MWCYGEAVAVPDAPSHQHAPWRVHQQGTSAGLSALPLQSMAEWRPSTRSTTSFGGPLLPSAGARCRFAPKWLVPGGVEAAGAGGSSSDSRASRASSSPISAFYALRSPASGGEGAQALDCFFHVFARVLSVICNAFSSNSRFSRARDAKGHCCNFCTHRL
jgi:hypothetical protein